MSPITTHVLDTAKGCPAAQIEVTLEFQKQQKWSLIAKGITDSDGRIMNWFNDSIEPGEYRIQFAISNYQKGFFPKVTINFTVENSQQHYHVPLLLSPYGYSTYRGS